MVNLALLFSDDTTREFLKQEKRRPMDTTRSSEGTYDKEIEIDLYYHRPLIAFPGPVTVKKK
jgi:homoaconitase/3-isopropylmalate dehydratase large subunit